MEHDLTHLVTRFAFQLSIILMAAKLAGEVCERWLKIPPVLGELLAGVIIGPHLLGGMRFGPLGPLFPEALGANTTVTVPTEVYAFAQIAAVLLLFMAGLETNLQQFLRYAGPASLVAVGGVLLPFFLGAGVTVGMGFAPQGFADPHALFMGAVLTATSVGITARVLADIRRLNTPEGVTVLAAAVIDDVLGILVLTVVVGIADRGGVSFSQVALVGGKAIGFWLGLTGVGILIAMRVGRFLEGFKLEGAAAALAVALGLLGAALAESVGLAMIIGAYSVGLALSRTPLAHRITPTLMGAYHLLVPVFFVVMGTLVDIRALGGALVFGLLITAAAFISKIAGCGLPALGLGFTGRGALRIGVGMLPRGEVALIVAGVGLTRGVVSNEMFSVAVLMTVATTLVAPIWLVPLFQRGGPGLRKPSKALSEAPATAQSAEDGGAS